MDNMLNIIDDDEAEDAQKRRNAANNILVLAREEATANQLCAKGGVAKLKDMLEDDDREVKLAAVRALVSNLSIYTSDFGQINSQILRSDRQTNRQCNV